MSEENNNGNGNGNSPNIFQSTFNKNINLFLMASMIPTAYTACKNKTYAKFIGVLLILSIILLVLTTIFPCDDAGCKTPGGIILLGILITLPIWLVILTTSWAFASFLSPG